MPAVPQPCPGRSPLLWATPRLKCHTLCECVMHKHGGLCMSKQHLGRGSQGSAGIILCSLSLHALGVHRGAPVKALWFYCPCSCLFPIAPDSLRCSVCCSSHPSAIKLDELIIEKEKNECLSDGGGRLLLSFPHFLAAAL